jgi:c-di-GMP-binding flagellar brake protein YcgR
MFDPIQFDTTIERRSFDREQRGALRLSLDPGEATLEPYGLDGVELVDVSVSGVGLMLPREFDQHRGEFGGVLRLGGRSSEVRLKPMRVAMESDTRRLGARFIDPTGQTRKDLGQFLIEGFIRRERRLSHLWLAREKALLFRGNTLVTDLLRHKTLRQATPLYVYRDMVPLHMRLFALKLGQFNGRNVLFALPDAGDALSLSSDSEYDFVLAGKTAASVFSSTILHVTNQSVLIEIPSEIRQCGFRESGRRKLSDAESVPVVARHASVTDESLQGFLLDVSVGGFSFILQNDLELLMPGDRLPQLTVDLPVGSLTVSAVVRRVAPSPNGAGLECGIEIIDFSCALDREFWERFVFERLHPRMRVNEPYIVQAAWNLLESSEYLGRWTPGNLRDYLECSFTRSWQNASKDIGHLMILEDDARKVGTCAASRIYPRTWLLHSLGMDKVGRARTRSFLDITRELYGAIIHLVQRSHDSTYFVGYVEKDKRWTKLLYGDFVSAYADRSASLYDEYRLFKRQTSVPIADQSHDCEFSIARLKGAQISEISQRIRAIVPEIESDAYGYSEREIDFCAFREAFSGVGADRTREIAIAYSAGLPLAVLIAETGNEGTSVFGLLNQCRIFWFESAHDRSAIKQALLSEAVKIYQTANRREFLFLDWDTNCDDDATQQGYEFISDGIRWLARMDIMPAWRSYIEEMLGLRGGDRPAPRNVQNSGHNLDAF